MGLNQSSHPSSIAPLPCTYILQLTAVPFVVYWDSRVCDQWWWSKTRDPTEREAPKRSRHNFLKWEQLEGSLQSRDDGEVERVVLRRRRFWMHVSRACARPLPCYLSTIVGIGGPATTCHSPSISNNPLLLLRSAASHLRQRILIIASGADIVAYFIRSQSCCPTMFILGSCSLILLPCSTLILQHSASPRVQSHKNAFRWQIWTWAARFCCWQLTQQQQSGIWESEQVWSLLLCLCPPRTISCRCTLVGAPKTDPDTHLVPKTDPDTHHVSHCQNN